MYGREVAAQMLRNNSRITILQYILIYLENRGIGTIKWGYILSKTYIILYKGVLNLTNH